ncbi:hypothetical protein [Marinovum algicola]|uniref:hypothetical protein n=1 Tax=Marinovum algicola TaxID=42444 RepID=UPI003B528B55
MTSSTPERRFRVAEGAQDATRQASPQPCAPNDRMLFAWFFLLPSVVIVAVIAALTWWLS